MIPLTAICVLLIAVLAYEKWQNSKDREIREDAWRLERTALLNRIQAPEVAVVESLDTDDAPQYIAFDDDEAFAER